MIFIIAVNASCNDVEEWFLGGSGAGTTASSAPIAMTSVGSGDIVTNGSTMHTIGVAPAATLATLVVITNHCDSLMVTTIFLSVHPMMTSTVG